MKIIFFVLLGLAMSVGASMSLAFDADIMSSVRYAQKTLNGNFLDSAKVVNRFDVAVKQSSRLPFTREQVSECAEMPRCYVFTVASVVGFSKVPTTLASMKKLVGRRAFSSSPDDITKRGFSDGALKKGWRMVYFARGTEDYRLRIEPPTLYNNERYADATLVAYFHVLSGGLIERGEILRTSSIYNGRIVLISNPGDGIMFTAPSLSFVGKDDWYAVEVLPLPDLRHHR